MTEGIDVDLWARRFYPTPGATVQLVCFPHAGGAASYYLPFSQMLCPQIDVVAIQYPGRQDRQSEPCLDSVAALADAVLEPVLASAAERLALFGHSMGASVAYEVACRLEERGVFPTALFVSGRGAPSLSREEHLHLYDDNSLIEDIRKLSGTDHRILDDVEHLRLILPAIRGDYRAAGTYRWHTRSPLRTPVHAHIGLSDPRVSVDEARAWRDHTVDEFSLTTHPGGHFYLNAQMARLTRAISATLRNAPRPAAP